MLRITQFLQQPISCNIPMYTTIEWPVVIMRWFSTPNTPCCLVCTTNSKLKYIFDFHTLSDPGSISADFQGTGSTPPEFQQIFRAFHSQGRSDLIFWSPDYRVFLGFLLSDRDSVYSRKILFEILGPPAKTCLKVTGTPLQTCWNFGSREYLQSDPQVCEHLRHMHIWKHHIDKHHSHFPTACCR